MRGKNTKRRRAGTNRRKEESESREQSVQGELATLAADTRVSDAVSRVCIARLALASVRVQWSLSGRGDAEPAETAKPT